MFLFSSTPVFALTHLGCIRVWMCSNLDVSVVCHFLVVKELDTLYCFLALFFLYALLCSYPWQDVLWGFLDFLTIRRFCVFLCFFWLIMLALQRRSFLARLASSLVLRPFLICNNKRHTYTEWLDEICKPWYCTTEGVDEGEDGHFFSLCKRKEKKKVVLASFLCPSFILSFTLKFSTRECACACACVRQREIWNNQRTTTKEKKSLKTRTNGRLHTAGDAGKITGTVVRYDPHFSFDYSIPHPFIPVTTSS